MWLTPDDVKKIQREVDEAGNDLHKEAVWYEEHDYRDKHKIARMAHSHLLSAYLELMNAVYLIEKLEDME